MRFALLSTLVLAVLSMAGCAEEGPRPTLDVSSLEDSSSILDLVTDGFSAEYLDDWGLDGSDASPLEPEAIDPVLGSAFQALLDDYLNFSLDSCVAMTVLDRHQYWHGAAGVLDLDSEITVLPEVGFRIGSPTKSLMAVITMQLWEEGLLDLEDPVTTWFPQYENWAEVTVEHLLRMSSGIVDFYFVEDFLMGMFLDSRRERTPEELLSFVYDLPLDYAPGSSATYCNTNYILVGMIIQAVTGQSLEDVVAERILEPLELVNCMFDVEGRTDMAWLAHGYAQPILVTASFGVPAQTALLLPKSFFREDGLVDAAYMFHPSVSWSAGGLVCCAPSMAKYMRALVRGELLGPEAQEHMMDFRVSSIFGGEHNYGMGISRSDSPLGVAIGHGGNSIGYATSTHVYPEADVVISRMHSAYPEQFGLMMGELYQVLEVDDPVPPYPCPPADLPFRETDPMTLEIHFRGIFNDPSWESTAEGIAHLKLHDPDLPFGYRLLHGAWAISEVIETETPAQVIVSSWSPSARSGFDLEWTELLLNADFINTDGGDGVVTVPPASPLPYQATCASVNLAPGTYDVIRICYSYVDTDVHGSSWQFCDAPSVTVAPWGLLRMHAAIPMTSDVDAIRRRFGEPCWCTSPGSSDWSPCPIE